MRIGVDLLGSETAPETFLEAVLEVKAQLRERCQFVLFGTDRLCKRLAKRCDRVEFVVVDEAITMDDDPLAAVRLKKRASLVLAVQQLKEGFIDGLLTAGNTGAIIASSVLFLSLFSGVTRPALIATLPALHKPFGLTDVGGSISASADRLVELAFLGAAYQRIRLGLQAPRVGLLNIGGESRKGGAEMREAFARLQEVSSDQMVFAGNVEGRDLFHAELDLVISEGFTGNVLLKAAEGISTFIFEFLQERLSSQSAKLADLQRPFSSAEHPGALLLGVKELIVKCHGTTTRQAVVKSLFFIAELIEKGVIGAAESSFSAFR